MCKRVSIAILLVVNACLAQRVLYDGTRDAQAQATVAAAKLVTSESPHETELRILADLGRQQLETVVNWQEVRARAALNSFSNWGDIVSLLDRVDNELAPFLDSDAEQALVRQRLTEIENEAEQLRAQIQQMQAEAGSQSAVVDRIFAQLGNAAPALNYASGLAGGSNPARTRALNEVLGALEQVRMLYTSIKGTLAARAAVSVPVASLRPDPLETELAMLLVEEEHWKTLGLIRARQALEVGEVKTLVDRVRGYTSRYPPDELIEDTLASLQSITMREQLEFALYVIHHAAAVAAQQETSAQLASLRTTIEERWYSIRRSTVRATADAQTAMAAAERLATYWKAGIRPQDMAGLLFQLSTAITLPIIAAQ